MWNRIKNFAKRHKKKLIAGGVLACGAYYAWKVALPRLQQRLIRKLLEDGDGLLQELARGVEGGAGTGASGAGAARGPEKGRAAFQHEQAVADGYARRALAALRPRLVHQFRIDEIKASLQDANISKEEKLERFRTFQEECLARTVSSLYITNLLLLLYRVEFNILGRAIASAGVEAAAGAPGAAAAAALASGDAAAAADASAAAAGSAGDEAAEGAPQALLDTTRGYEEQVLEAIAAACRTALKKVTESRGLAPSTKVDVAQLERYLLDVCEEVNATVLSDSGAAALLLPENAGAKVPVTELGLKVKAYLDEARDYLDSPHFLEAARASALSSVRCLVGLLGDSPARAPAPAPAPAADGADAAAAVAAPAVRAGPLAGGKSCPLASTFGPLMQASGAAFDAEGDATLVERLSAEPTVVALGEALYSADSRAKSDADGDPVKCPQQ